MKALILILSSPVLFLLTLCMFTTLEYSLEYNEPYPFLSAAVVTVLDIIWCRTWCRCSRMERLRAFVKYEQLCDRLLKGF